MLSWDLETDVVTPGQWLSGSFHLERSDLSPDGKLLVYLAASYKPEVEENAWTAISRPPYFTALALWFKSSTYYGGGLFEDSKSILLNDIDEHRYSDRFPKPKLKVGSFVASSDHTEELRMVRDGWRTERARAKPRVLTKSVDGLEVTEMLKTKSSMEVRTYTASIDGQPIDVQGAKQVDIDAPRARIIYTVNGKIFAADGTTIKEVADLADNQFEPIPPPEWATVWP